MCYVFFFGEVYDCVLREERSEQAERNFEQAVVRAVRVHGEEYFARFVVSDYAERVSDGFAVGTHFVNLFARYLAPVSYLAPRVKRAS